MFRDHPIAGVGTENFGHRAPEYRDLSRYRESMWHRSSHSLYFTLLPEHGLVGVFIYGGMLLATLKGHRRLQRRYREQPDDETRRSAAILSGGLFAGIAASMITGVFVSVLYYPSVWVLVCMVGSTVATADAADAARVGAAR
jgi:O-antigen ligase